MCVPRIRYVSLEFLEIRYVSLEFLDGFFSNWAELPLKEVSQFFQIIPRYA